MIYIFIVSHGHDAFICSNQPLLRIAARPDTQVVILDNIGQKPLQAYCHEQGLAYVKPPKKQGFAANNNYLFAYLRCEVGAQDSDIICLINPDVVIEHEAFSMVVEQVAERSERVFFTINLFHTMDEDPDPNIKRFPRPGDFLQSFLLGRSPASYDKKRITKPVCVDWCSGAFMVISVGLYRQLQGFDARFFMYFEDVDFCRRVYEQQNVQLTYYPEIKALHKGQRANQRIFSRHFWWFMRSMLRYFVKYPRLPGLRTSDE